MFKLYTFNTILQTWINEVLPNCTDEGTSREEIIALCMNRNYSAQVRNEHGHILYENAEAIKLSNNQGRGR